MFLLDKILGCYQPRGIFNVMYEGCLEKSPAIVNVMSAAQIKLWHKCFKDGRESVESYSRSGRPAASRTPENVECVLAVLKKVID